MQDRTEYWSESPEWIRTTQHLVSLNVTKTGASSYFSEQKEQTRLFYRFLGFKTPRQHRPVLRRTWIYYLPCQEPSVNFRVLAAFSLVCLARRQIEAEPKQSEAPWSKHCSNMIFRGNFKLQSSD